MSSDCVEDTGVRTDFDKYDYGYLIVNEKHKTYTKTKRWSCASSSCGQCWVHFEFCAVTAVTPLPMSNESPRPTQRFWRMSRSCVKSYEAVSVQTHIRVLVGDSSVHLSREDHLLRTVQRTINLKTQRTRPTCHATWTRIPDNLLLLSNVSEAQPPRMIWSEQTTSDGCTPDGEGVVCAPKWPALSLCDAAKAKDDFEFDTEWNSQVVVWLSHWVLGLHRISRVTSRVVWI